MFDYLNVLADLHETRRPRTYLEVGVFCGDSLRLVREDTFCVGVDPEPTLAPGEESHCHIERITSDAFFAGPRPRELFGDRPIDMVFIDGMHLFEYALRDFINAEAMASSESLILLHDCLPQDALTSSRERTTAHWTGDVWKVVVCLLDRRPDLDLAIVDVPPSGLCLVSGLNPKDQTLRNCYDALVEQYLPMGFEVWEARLADVLRRTTDTPEAQAWSLRMEIAVLQDRLAEREAQTVAEIAGLHDRLAEREAQTAAEIAALHSRLAESEAQTAAFEAQLRSVYTSTSWRFSAPIRRVGALLRRGGGA
jgi:Methyltransferase domain